MNKAAGNTCTNISWRLFPVLLDKYPEVEFLGHMIILFFNFFNKCQTVLCNIYTISWTCLVAQLVKDPPAVWETWVQSLGWEDPLEKGTATHSSILAWRIPWTVYPWGHKESDMTEWLSLYHFIIPPTVHKGGTFSTSLPALIFCLYFFLIMSVLNVWGDILLWFWFAFLRCD